MDLESPNERRRRLGRQLVARWGKGSLRQDKHRQRKCQVSVPIADWTDEFGNRGSAPAKPGLSGEPTTTNDLDMSQNKPHTTFTPEATGGSGFGGFLCRLFSR